MDQALAAALGVSLALNVLSSLAYFRLRRRPKEVFDLTAQDLLHDLTRRGQAVLRVEVIDPSAILLRRPI